MIEGARNGWHGDAVRRWLVAAALALVSLSATAFDPYPDFTFAPTSGGVGGTVTRGSAAAWTAGTKTPTSTGLMFSSGPKSLPFEPPTTGVFKALFTPKNLAKAAVTGAAVAIPIVAGQAIALLLQQACIRAFGGAMTLAPGGQWEECHFDTVQGSYIAGYPVNDTLASDINATCLLHLQKHYANLGANGHSGIYYNGSNVPFCRIYTNDFNNYVNQSGFSYAPMQAQNGYQPSTPARAEAALEAALDAQAGADFARGAEDLNKSLQKFLEDLFKAGQPVDATLEPPVVQTPVIQPGPTKQTTDSAGKTTNEEEATRNDYNCTVIQDGKAVACTQTRTTTGTQTTVSADPSNPGGTTTTVVTTTTTTPEDPSKDDPCVRNPDRVGCMKVGDVDTTEIPKATKSISWVQENLFGGGSCPAPLSWSDSAGSHTISYAQICDFLSSVVRPLVLAFASLTAIFIVGGFRTGGGD